MRPAPKLVVRVLRVMFAFELGLNRLDLGDSGERTEHGHRHPATAGESEPTSRMRQGGTANCQSAILPQGFTICVPQSARPCPRAAMAAVETGWLTHRPAGSSSNSTRLIFQRRDRAGRCRVKPWRVLEVAKKMWSF